MAISSFAYYICQNDLGFVIFYDLMHEKGVIRLRDHVPNWKIILIFRNKVILLTRFKTLHGNKINYWKG